MERRGKVEYLGRMDEQVKVRGYRVELNEIEQVLREHESVGAVAVVMKERGIGDQRLLGYVEKRGEEELKKRTC